MTPHAILLDCVKRGVMIWGEEGELCFRAPQGIVTPEFRSALKLHKSALLRLLGNRQRHSVASYEQQRLWFLSQLDESSVAYAIQFVIQLDGHFDKVAFTKSLETIVARHEPLRTTFKTIAGEMVQVVHDTMHTPINFIDVLPVAEELHDETIAEIVDATAMEPFDLSTGPLLRATLIRKSDACHVLILTMHHIAADGWSLGVFFRELSGNYNRAVTGNSGAIQPELQLSYTDYARNQRLGSGKYDADLQYWREKLTPLPPRLDLKAIGAAAATEKVAGLAMHVLNEELSQKFSAWCRDNGATQFTALLAIFAGLLHRYSGQKSFTIGVPVAGRRTQGAESLIGFFVNMLVIRCDTDSKQPFSAFLNQFKHDVLEALEHQDLPFARLVEALQPERSTVESPLFQVGFSMQNFGSINLDLDGIGVRTLKRSIADAKYALCLFARERDGKLHLRLEYRGDVLNDSNARRMLQHFERLLEGVIAQPQHCLLDYSLLSEDERNRLTVEFNATGVSYERDKTVHACFEAQVAKNPDAIAVSDRGKTFTYRELDHWANGIAQWLAGHTSHEARVGVLVERGAGMVAAVLGVLKAGAAYLPLDPAFPQRRMHELLDDGEAVCVISDSQSVSMLGDDRRPRLLIDAEGAALRADNAPHSSATADSLAYVMYTSGSTGTPKGVCVEHRNIVRLVKKVNFGTLDAQTIGLVYAPLAFDASTVEMFGPLLNGGRIVLQAPGGASVEELATTIEEYGVNTLWLTAGLFHQMAENGPLHKLKGLRQWLSGGDVMQANSVRRVMEALPNCLLINGYGPTEAATLAVAHTMQHADAVPDRIPIGRPLQNTQVYVLDESQQLVPIGLAGELCIGGDAVARGYLNRPELTADRFVRNPFSTDQNARMYRTGDRARWTEHGLLQFLGRNDGQVKLRGYRVELGEIENALCQHACVSQAAVAVKKRGSDKVLVAYVVSNNGVELDLDALRAHLRERLPAFMAPAVLIPLESIPLTPNGKADRASLPDPNSRDHQAAAAEYLAPRNEVEARAARLFEGVLGVKSPSVNANFFELGGHSLMATQLVSRIREEFTVEISLRDFFHTPTIEALASAIAAGKANGFGSAINRQSLSLEEQLDALDCAASGVRAS